MKKHKTVDHGRYGIYFSLAFFIVFAIFQLYPLILTFTSSFKYTEWQGRKSHIVNGVGNFTHYVFGSTGDQHYIWQAIVITMIIWFLNFIPQVLLALLLAAWFTNVNFKLKGAAAFKVIMYMPNIITAATIAVLFYQMFNNRGSITSMLIKHGIVPKSGILTHGWTALLIIAFIQFWMWYGNTMIVLCAGILGINPSLYEAAMVDGATGKQQFFKITLPLLKPILQYTLVTSAIGGLQMFDIPSLFNKGGPLVKLFGENAKSTTTVTMLIKDYTNTGNSQDIGRAAAYSVVLFVVTLAISMIFYIATSEKKHKNER